ncbi:MAG: DNA methyltransferase [Candidatus Saccharibacteria bacterium]
MGKYFIHDARTLSEVVPNNIDLIITSPPYFDLKDYGSDNQIGFGQGYDDYLDDMEKVLRQCFIVTKDTGSMWLVVDTLKKNGQFKVLPFDISRIAEKAGWKLQEIIIWKKDRTLPYSRKGEMRNIFEYILFFVKTSDFKYFPKRITDLNPKEWWVKYPERYSTSGKIPTDVWEFPIPVQGSWGKSYIRHFCPLPNGMMQRIIKLCTDPGDIVFDPFAGSGAVLSEAYALKRDFIGCDLNPSFKGMFEDYLKQVVIFDDTEDIKDKELFGKTVGKLRILKLPSAILKKLRVTYPEIFDEIEGVYIEALKDKPATKNKHWAARYVFAGIKQSSDEDIIRDLFRRAPFSKYGIEADITFESPIQIEAKYEFEWSGTHKKEMPFTGQKRPFIASNLKLTDKERDLVNSST